MLAVLIIDKERRDKMRASKVKKGVAILMSVVAICPMLVAQENSAAKQEGVITTENVIEQVGMYLPEEMIARIKEEGIQINQTQVNGNIKVTAEAIWADRYTYKILLAIEHVDKTPFAKDVEIQFIKSPRVSSKKAYEIMKVVQGMSKEATMEEEINALSKVEPSFKQFIKADGSIDTEGYIRAITKAMCDGKEGALDGIDSGSFMDCGIEGVPDYKKYFILEGSDFKEIAANGVLVLGGYRENVRHEQASTLDLVDYLKAHKEDVLKTQPNKFEKGEEQGVPKKLLMENNLKLPIIKGVADYCISDMGFVDGAFHMSAQAEKGKYFTLTLENEEGVLVPNYTLNFTTSGEQGERMRQDYAIYPIKDVAELGKYQLQINTEERLTEVKEDFVFELKNKIAAETNTALNKKVILNGDNHGILKNVIQTDLSLKLVFEDLEADVGLEENLMVIFKDGSQKQVYVRASGKSVDETILIYDIADIKKEVAKIMLGDVELLSYK